MIDSTPIPPPAIRLDRGVRRRGRVLIGGTPRRVLRLTDSGVGVFERLVAGERAWSSGSTSLARRLLRGGFAHPVVGGGGPTIAQVAGVVPVRDDADGLGRLLGSGAFDGLAEVVVIDDGSVSGDVAAVAGRHRVRLLVNRAPVGPGAARERGWRSTAAEFVAFVDADCVPPVGWLEPLLGYFDDHDVVAVAPRIAGVNGPADHTLARYERDHGPIDRGVGAAAVGSGAVTFVPSAALVVRRCALEAVGGFDETLPVGEDVDLVWRLLEHGSVRYEPAVHVSHRSRRSVGSWLRQRFRYGQSAAALHERHPRRLAAIEANPWTAATWVLHLFGTGRWRFLGLATNAVSTGWLVRRLHGAVDRPVRTAVELARCGNLAAGRALAETARREWWPLALAGAALTPRLRRPLAVAYVAYPLIDEMRSRPEVGILRAAALSVADDMAYGAGVWAGCWQHRRWGPVLPRSLRQWPGGPKFSAEVSGRRSALSRKGPAFAGLGWSGESEQGEPDWYHQHREGGEDDRHEGKSSGLIVRRLPASPDGLVQRLQGPVTGSPSRAPRGTDWGDRADGGPPIRG